MTKQARVAGVEIFDLLRLCDYDGPPGLVFGYGAITTTRIDSGLAVLCRCFERVLGAGRT